MPAAVLDVATRSRTRFLFLYGLVGLLTPEDDAGVPLTEVFECGRFAPHLEAASRLLPRIHLEEALAPDALGSERGASIPPLASLRLLLAVTPRGDAALLLEGVLAEESDADAINALLAATCFDRTELTVSGTPILDWVSRLIDPAGEFRLRFGRDVHQVVYPGGELLRKSLATSRPYATPTVVADMVYRGTIQIRHDTPLSVRTPRALNNPGVTAVAHGRGVSVIAGWESAAENALGVGALVLVCALEVLQRARHRAFRALTQNERAKLASTADARTLVSDLSSQLNELQLDLSFGVEAYIDSVLIPDLVVESFQTSLRDGMGITDALLNTSRMLERLQSVIQARRSTLRAAANEQDEQRHRVFSLIIAIGSLIALPPALLLAFFGVNGLEVDPGSSIFDMARYWPAYLLAWLPFLALVVAGFVPLRRIRTSSGLLRRELQERGHRLLYGTGRLRGRRRDRPSTLEAGTSTPESPMSSTDPLPRQRAADDEAHVDIDEIGPPDTAGAR